MAIAAEAIYRGIIDVIEGRQGGRRVEAGAFQHRNLFGESPEKQRSSVKGCSGSYFDVRLRSMADNGSSPISVISSERHLLVDVDILFLSHFDCDTADLSRIAYHASLASQLDDVAQALGFGDAITFSQGEATSVVSGILLQFSASGGLPAWRLTAEDWVNHVIEHQMSAQLVVIVTMNAPQ